MGRTEGLDEMNHHAPLSEMSTYLYQDIVLSAQDCIQESMLVISSMTTLFESVLPDHSICRQEAYLPAL